MGCPGMKGMGKDDCIILKKCIYGLVQAAIKCNKKAVEILKRIDFTGGNIDPCLYKKKGSWICR